MNEKTIERTLREKVKAAGGVALKFFSPSFTGLPDRLVLMPGGRVWFVELKAPGKKPKPRQVIVHTMLRKLGFNVEVIDTTAGVNEFVNRIAA